MPGTPKMTRHARGQAVVRLNGKDHYLGPFGSREAQAAYDVLIQRWLANGRRLPDDAGGPRPATVNELCLAFLRWAEGHYRDRDKKVASEVKAIKEVVRILRGSFGRDPAGEFGPKKLKDARAAMAAKGWSRRCRAGSRSMPMQRRPRRSLSRCDAST